MIIKHKLNRGGPKQGAALVLCVLVVSAVAVMSLSLATTSLRSKEERKQAHASMNAVYIAEAGIRMAAMDLLAGRSGDLGNPQNQLSYGTGSYDVDTTPLASGLIQITSTGSENGSSATVQMVLQPASSSPFPWAAFGEESVIMDSSALVDSYDSSLGIYAGQKTNGKGNSQFALDNGHVGSNQDIMLFSNAQIFGDATPGPSHSAITTGNSAISGATTPASQDYIVDALEFPVIASTGALSVSGNQSLASGDYYFSTLKLDGSSTLVIQGPAVIVVDQMKLDSNSNIRVDATDGDVEFWVYNDFEMDSNTLMASTTYDPANIQLYLNADNILDPEISVDVDVEVGFDSNANFYGTILAPNSAIDIESNFALFGAVVAKRVRLASNSKIHFDENLLTLSSSSATGYTTVGWRIIGN